MARKPCGYCGEYCSGNVRVAMKEGDKAKITCPDCTRDIREGREPGSSQRTLRLQD